jgi:hypothetical protein
MGIAVKASGPRLAGLHRELAECGDLIANVDHPTPLGALADMLP